MTRSQFLTIIVLTSLGFGQSAFAQGQPYTYQGGVARGAALTQEWLDAGKRALSTTPPPKATETPYRVKNWNMENTCRTYGTASDECDLYMRKFPN